MNYTSSCVKHCYSTIWDNVYCSCIIKSCPLSYNYSYCHIRFFPWCCLYYTIIVSFCLFIKIHSYCSISSKIYYSTCTISSYWTFSCCIHTNTVISIYIYYTVINNISCTISLIPCCHTKWIFSILQIFCRNIRSSYWYNCIIYC